MNFLDGFQVLQAIDQAPDVSVRAVDFAGQMARQLGAEVFTTESFASDGSFLGRGKTRCLDDPFAWAQSGPNRILLVAGGHLDKNRYRHLSAVLVHADPWAAEASCFAESAIADLLGDPDRAPLIPEGNYAAGTASYGILAALCCLVTKIKRFGVGDVVETDVSGTLAWVNWKAASAGDMGKDICRQGSRAEWPVVPCADGFVALVYQERDWQPILDMVDDDRLRDERFSTFKGRSIHRDEYMAVLREWTSSRSKSEIMHQFLLHEIPAAPVMTEADLLNDPLLLHREAFAEERRANDDACKSPRLAHRVIHSTVTGEMSQPDRSGLPLSGLRVLDLGIITAGAGVGALLGDLGAEVLKIESKTYPDPFRQWAGDAVSPLFKCNNRNKFGLAIDLKTPEGRTQFLGLVKSADLVIENFRRGVLDRLGFDYETLKSVNPRIVLASISGQGLDGPGSEATSFGSTLEASSGFSANTHYEDGLPYITGRNLNYPDQTVVLYAGAVITAALADRSVGMQLDVSQRDVAVYLAGEAIEQLSAGEQMKSQGNGRCYQAADGRWVAVGSALPSSTEDLIAENPSEVAVDQLRSMGVSACRVNAGSEMLEHFKRSYQFARSPNGDLVKGFPFQFLNTPMKINLDSPEVGEHTEQFVEGVA